ncbi:MAG: 2-phospho-L-lactate guanylyltransferase [Lacisediminihabitans sp.]
MTEWVVVIPVKGTDAAKSRLDLDQPVRGNLAFAFALDTVRASLAAPSVAEVVVVAGSAEVDEPLRQAGAQVIRETTAAGVGAGRSAAGLNAAIEQGIAEAVLRHPSAGVAVLLGDLPALTGSELEAALGQAAGHARAMVADAAGVGTVLVTARAGERHSVRFGGRSREAHLAAGYTGLEVDGSFGLRHDVDTMDDLSAVSGLALGDATRAVLRRPPHQRSATTSSGSNLSDLPVDA